MPGVWALPVPAALSLDQLSGHDQRFEHLFQEERIAFGQVIEGIEHSGGERTRPVQDGLQERLGVDPGQRFQEHFLPLPLAVELRQQGAQRLMCLIASIGQHHQETLRRCLAREEEEKLQGALIAPMDIFDHQQERSGGRGSHEDVSQQSEEAAFLLFRFQGRQWREACEFGQVLDLLRKQGKERACGGSQRRRDLVG